MFDVSFYQRCCLKMSVRNVIINVKRKIVVLLLEQVTDTSQNFQGNFLRLIV